jgi:hypothetical protein
MGALVSTFTQPWSDGTTGIMMNIPGLKLFGDKP